MNKSDFWLKSKLDDTLVHITEGDGMNLTDEDEEEGYVDYIYYTTFANESDCRKDLEEDGGQVMLTELYEFMTTGAIIEAVIYMMGGNGKEWAKYWQIIDVDYWATEMER